MLVSMKEILDRANKEGYGVIAPNIVNEPTARICIDLAEELKAPLILGFGFNFHPDIVKLGRIVEILAFNTTVPIALHLDHGNDLYEVLMAIKSGFTSVMIDKSREDFEENVKQTKAVVELAHSVGISVEGELGHVGRASDNNIDSSNLTDPYLAEEFVRKTNVDCLAVAVGTAHGLYKAEPKLDLERIKKIHELTQIPLVLHGGSGVGSKSLRHAIANGVAKINIATDNFVAALDNLKGLSEPHMLYHCLEDGFKKSLRYYMEQTDQIGKSWFNKN
ncbi:MAG: class II fructose-bisphosphate aldolase [Clostridiaceae bacterium]|nr:class II fructose-bisphosphate aldolase [Clostridiaceae bacterium]